eukprot:TRINITY_DN15513_c0_g2_i1.p1 TRINITY_DN15513_c0_g2~~TRINITY_DN15513_c0_g2_i1.p1  ORF type:complete len:518 (-),score=104.31 TRINITY_DN15513_c0_g2_i1:367-1920(-)
MGHSLGCGPTLNLAVKRGELNTKLYPTPNKVAGAILKSAFASSCAVAYPKCGGLKNGCCECCDLFRNIDRVGEIDVPVMVVHSKNDEMIDISHGERLHAGLPSQCQWDAWWLQTERHAHLPINAREFFKRLDDFLEHLEDHDPTLDQSQQEESQLIRTSLQEMPLVPILQEIQLQLFSTQHALLLCCNKGRCCVAVKASLKQKVAAMDEKCREAHRVKRSSEPYGGPFPVETVVDELELILQRMQLITRDLEEPPAVHDAPRASSDLSEKTTPVNNEEENPLTPKGSMIHRLATSALVNLDGFDDGRYVLRLKPLKGWFQNGQFEANIFEAAANALLQTPEAGKALYVEYHDVTETEGDVWCPVVSALDLEETFAEIVRREQRCILAGLEVLSVSFQGPLEVSTVVMRESEASKTGEDKDALGDCSRVEPDEFEPKEDGLQEDGLQEDGPKEDGPSPALDGVDLHGVSIEMEESPKGEEVSAEESPAQSESPRSSVSSRTPLESPPSRGRVSVETDP